MNKAILAATLYLLVGIFSFGHCAANLGAFRTSFGKTLPTSREDRAVHGFMAGMFWPLYWSWEYFETSAEKD